jgi:flagellar biosynthesis protein FlhF
MQIKRFEARDMKEAVKLVKEVMGLEAIILSTKTIRKPGDGIRPGRQSFVEVVAAMDPQEKSRPGPPSKNEARFHPGVLGKIQESAPIEEDPCLQKILTAGLYPDFVSRLMEEMRALRKEAGVWNIPETYRGFLQWKLMEAVEVVSPELQGKKIWSFIGPTGVGKTTTLAKIAAQFSLRFGKTISLITLDTYRIGGLEQLKTYARILRLPFEVAGDPDELKEIITRNRDQDLLLIDTAGRNPQNMEQLEELNGFLTVDPRIQNHLVLSATTKDGDLAKGVQRFSLLPIASYIFTKIDETEHYASLFNQLLRYPRPLSYLTNGQRVPEDIEFATKGRVANLILQTVRWN